MPEPLIVAVAQPPCVSHAAAVRAASAGVVAWSPRLASSPAPSPTRQCELMRNWAGNLTYQAARLVRPATVGELQEVVAGSARVRALGSRHSFSDIADTTGTHVLLDALPADIVIDGDHVSVPAGVRYGVLAEALAAHGRALGNLASLPHISVGGAIATGTHGSGDHNGCLAAAVAAIELVDAAGEIRHLSRGEPEFAGSVVALGALGVVTRVRLDTVPAFAVRQDVYPDVPWSGVLAGLDAVLASAYSVSLFTNWTGDTVGQVWLKSAGTTPPADLFGAPPAPRPLHMLAGEPVDAVTEQGGVPGPWLDRLPHFRLGHKPSSGEELQSEYLLPRKQAIAALTRLRALGPRLAPVLRVSEIRSVAADDLWLSGAYGRDVLAVHFTWRLDPPGVYRLLPDLEAALLPLGARPHWGKCFATAPRHPRLADFAELRRHHDPGGKFGNAYLDRVLD